MLLSSIALYSYQVLEYRRVLYSTRALVLLHEHSRCRSGAVLRVLNTSTVPVQWARKTSTGTELHYGTGTRNLSSS